VPDNYFNYFTEIEEHFQRARGTGLFLLSPLDWALIESWKNSGVPLEAVLRGIDAAFEKWRARPQRARFQKVNSVAYCAQAVAEEAQSMAAGAPAKREAPPPFSLEDVRAHIQRNAEALRTAGHGDLAESLERLDLEELYRDLEQLEQRLTAIEEKMIARARSAASEEALFEARRSLDQELKPYRGKMSAEQLATLERQFLDRKVIEAAGLPRLSLFYLAV
jgi:DNA repair exonuclease SbcCD ATPase subunit